MNSESMSGTGDSPDSTVLGSKGAWHVTLNY